MKLGIIIVEYKSVKLTVDFIVHLQSTLHMPADIAIVSYESTPSDIDLYLEKFRNLSIHKVDQGNEDPIDISGSHCEEGNNKHILFKNIYLLRSEKNLGFAKGCNVGAKFLINHCASEILLFTNNDIRITSNIVIPELIKKLLSCSQIGMIGPEIVGLDGKRQSPEPYISIGDRFLWMYLLTPFLSKEKKRRKFALDYAENAQEGFHFRIMGSFFLMRTEVFMKINGFDPHTFLYAEEMILSKKMEKAGYSAYFLPSVRVIHVHGQTTNKHLTRKSISNHQIESEVYFYTHYCHVPYWKATLLATILKILNLMRL